MMERAASNGSSKAKLFNRTRARVSLRMPNHSHPSKPPFDYIRGELIGKGSYGRVYLGLNAKTGEVMAIKQVELTPSAINRSISQKQREIIDAFKRESDMLRGLDHENIVQYLGYEEHPQYLNIFLEYVPGGTIKTCLTRYGRFREDVTKSLTFQILAGLEYLHSKAIIHRDLKADNILLEPSGICKISDFGISKQIEDIHDQRAFTGMRGTVQWMAPEIVDPKKGGYDAKVDIWSVGCIVLEMWSGEQPWSGESIISVMFKLSQHKQAPPMPATVRLGPLAEQFRLRCFEPNPGDRPNAIELKEHQYLRLPPLWQFPYVMHDRNANRKSKTKSFMTIRRCSFSVDPDAPPVPTVKPSVDLIDVNNAAEPEPRHPLNTEAVHADIQSGDSKTVLPCNQNDGPPIVVITPPGSPKERSFSKESSGTSEDTGFFRRRRRRPLIVANPDDEDHENLVFIPPPLPETTLFNFKRPASRSSVSLHRPHPPFFSEYPSPSTKSPTVNINGTPPSVSPSSSRSGSTSSTDNSSLSLTARPPRSDNTSYSDDSETDDDDLYLWNKPPADLRRAPNGRLLTSPSSPTLTLAFKSAFQPSVSDARKRASRTSRMMNARESARPRDSWLVRPDVQDVLDDLQNFFPRKDVSHAIAQPEAAASHGDVPAAPAPTKKQQAETTQPNLGPFRRMTMLWRSHSQS